MLLERLFYGFIRNSLKSGWESYSASGFAFFLYINSVTVFLAFDQIAKRKGWWNGDFDKYYFITAGLIGASVAIVNYKRREFIIANNSGLSNSELPWWTLFYCAISTVVFTIVATKSAFWN